MQQFDFSSERNTDYTFGDQVETVRIELQQDVGQAIASPGVLRTILYFSGHIISCFMQGPLINFYRANGPLLQTINLESVVTGCQITQVTHLMIPRLDWQEREFD